MIVGLKVSLSRFFSAPVQVPKMHLQVVSMYKVFLGSDFKAHN